MKFPVPFRFLFWLYCWIQLSAIHLAAADSDSHFDVRGYQVIDTIPGSSTNVVPTFSSFTGTNISLNEIVHAAFDVQLEYANRGYPTVSVAIGEREITNGIVTMHVFQSAVPQIRISGKRYTYASNEVVQAENLLPASVTSPVASHELVLPPTKPPTPEQEALRKKMDELTIAEKRAAIPPQPPPTSQTILAPPPFTDTNDVQLVLRHEMYALNQAERRALLVPPGTNSPADTSTKASVFEVKGYEVIGNTLLPPSLTELILQPYIGTNMTFERVRAALTDLQIAYHDYGFATVAVTLPVQTRKDKIVMIRVFEGRLSEIVVENNRYFSSNNIMRALPSLHLNMILTEPIFQAELDRANANQDRQIYPKIEPGVVEGTSLLRLNVRDRFPLHAKTEFNNENSPGTPALRINSSAEYKNLWQLEHSLGIQYSFSPEMYKVADEWAWYDRPLVANYSGFYRVPLSPPESVENTVSSSKSFGYDEGTRKFNLPPPSGQAELNIFASRSAIDTGLETSPEHVIFNVPGVRTVTRQDIQQDITVNNAIGFQLTEPLPELDGIFQGVRATWSVGMTYKNYKITSARTNEFRFSEITVDANGNPNPPIISTVSSPVPLTKNSLEYLPVQLRYDASRPNWLGIASFGLGLTFNPWYSGAKTNMQHATGSTNSSGYWVVLNPSLSQDINLPKKWTLSLHGEGQWANEPLLSTEQFGSGGVNSVRGYHEGEVFGDSGWRLDAELKTPPHVAGLVYGKQALTLRGSIYTDYSEVYLADAHGGNDHLPLWSAGVGTVVSVGTHWEGRLWFAVPFERTTTIEPMRPRFNFSLMGQF